MQMIIDDCFGGFPFNINNFSIVFENFIFNYNFANFVLITI